MRKYIHIIIAIIIIALPKFIKGLQDYMIVFIILQAINAFFLIIELKKEIELKKAEPCKDDNEGFVKINSYFLVASIVLSALVFLIHLFSTNLSEQVLEVIMGIIFIYSILFTILAGKVMDKASQSMSNKLRYLLNAILIALICFFVVGLKTDSYIYLINKEIKDLYLYLNLAILLKFGIDIIVAFNLNFAL